LSAFAYGIDGKEEKGLYLDDLSESFGDFDIYKTVATILNRRKSWGNSKKILFIGLMAIKCNY
jgi:hypothetical protein